MLPSGDGPRESWQTVRVYASGEFFAFCDADDVVASDWARRLYDCAQATGAEFIAGHIDHDALYPYSVRRWPAAIHPVRRTGDRGRMPFAEGCNVLVSRHAFGTVDGFDESLAFAAEDIELSRRLQEAGFRLTPCPGAIVFYRDRTTLSACIRQAYRYGRGSRMHLRSRRAHGPRPTRPGAVALGLLVRMPLVLGTRCRRVTWLRQLAFWLGYARAGFGVAPGRPRPGLSGHAAPPGPAAAAADEPGTGAAGHVRVPFAAGRRHGTIAGRYKQAVDIKTRILVGTLTQRDAGGRTRTSSRTVLPAATSARGLRDT